MRKLDNLAVEELRDRYSLGDSTTTLAEGYGVTERHVRRLVAGLEPPPPAFTVQPNETVEAALDRYLDGIDRDPQGDVIAATARTLARRLDQADSRAAPALARTLVDVLDDLNGTTDNDAIARLRRRRDARRLLAQTAH